MKICFKTDFLWGSFQTLYKIKVGPGGFLYYLVKFPAYSFYF